MPRLEMTWEELLEYRPALAPPEGFAAFWREAVEAQPAPHPRLEGLEPHPELPLRLGWLSYRGADGTRLAARVVAGRRRPLGVAVRFPGYDTVPPPLTELIPWVFAGFTVVAAAVRGQPGGAFDPYDYGPPQMAHGLLQRGLLEAERSYYRLVYLDARALVEAAATLEGGDRVVLFGDSQGGGLSLAAAALSPPDRVKAVAISFPFPAHLSRAVDLAEEGPYLELASYRRRIDPEGRQEAAIARTLGMIDVLHHAPQVKVPTLLGIGGTDRICPPSASFAVARHLGGTVELRLYPHHGHEPLPGFADAALLFCRRAVAGRPAGKTA